MLVDFREVREEAVSLTNVSIARYKNLTTSASYRLEPSELIYSHCYCVGLLSIHLWLDLS